jgi:hypothetical protein
MPQAKKTKRKKWEGPLGQLILRPNEEFAAWLCRKTADSDPRIWIDEQIELERRHKLPLLLKHYGIAGKSGRDFMELAKRLAIDFVDGFKLAEFAPRSVGAPGRWTKVEGAQLVAEIEALKEAEGLNVAKALRLIRDLDSKRYGNMNERSLRKRYDEARNASAVSGPILPGRNFGIRGHAVPVFTQAFSTPRNAQKKAANDVEQGTKALD